MRVYVESVAEIIDDSTVVFSFRLVWATSENIYNIYNKYNYIYI